MQNSIENVSKLTPLIVTVFAVYFYFIGWLRIFYYLSEFRIDISQIEIPFHYFFLHAFSAIRSAYSIDAVLHLILFLAVVVLLVMVCGHLAGREKRPESATIKPSATIAKIVESQAKALEYLLVITSIFVFVIFLLAIGHSMARNSADEWIREVRLGRGLLLFEDPVQQTGFASRDNLKLFSDRYLNDFSENGCEIFTDDRNYFVSMVFASSSHYYLLFQPVDNASFRDNDRVRGHIMTVAVDKVDILVGNICPDAWSR